jgi:hypothetical protein
MKEILIGLIIIAGDISGVFYVDVHENCGDLILRVFINFNPNQQNKLSTYLNKHQCIETIVT